MLDRARRRAVAADRPDIRWIEGTAEEIGRLEVAPCRAVTFGQSFHRTDRQRAADAVYDALEPGGAIVWSVTGRGTTGAAEPGATPDSPRGDPPADRSATWARSRWTHPGERWEDSLRRTRFGEPRLVFAPGVPDYLRDEDSVVANFFSMSTSAPPRFGPRRQEFEAELRALLRAESPDGLFWDWPGDTEIVLAVRA